MTDKKFLIWIHERLEHQYKENAQYDFMHKLRAIISAIPDDKLTPNDGRGKSSISELLNT